MINYKTKLKGIKAFVFDVDGVMTDGKLTLMPDGSMLRQVNSKDGQALRSAIQKGYIIGIITGGWDATIKKRFKDLGVSSIYMRSLDKKEDFEDFLLMNDLKADQVAYMGDDVPDICVLQEVNVSACPHDAVREVLNIVDYVSPVKGGEGCVRDLIEQTMRLQKTW